MARPSFLTASALFVSVLWPCTSTALAATEVALPGDATALQGKYSEFQPQLKARLLGEPVHLVSHDTGSRLNADVYAELPQAFKPLSNLLGSPDSVCGVMFLHLNVRSCQAIRSAQGDGLVLTAGPKQGGAIGAVYTMQYAMRVESSTADYARVVLTAASGPLSTSDYRIVFEAVPLEGQRTFLHFGYSYSYGSMAKMALGLYLSTAGRSKIGFTVVGTGPDGKPKYVQGERGSIERNVIRNYLALVAYTSILGPVGRPQMDARLRAWFALSERYAPQLHELTLDEYLTQKQEDLAQSAVATR